MNDDSIFDDLLPVPPTTDESMELPQLTTLKELRDRAKNRANRYSMLDGELYSVVFGRRLRIREWLRLLETKNGEFRPSEAVKEFTAILRELAEENMRLFRDYKDDLGAAMDIVERIQHGQKIKAYDEKMDEVLGALDEYKNKYNELYDRVRTIEVKNK